MNREILRKAHEIDQRLLALEKEIESWESSDELLNPDSTIMLKSSQGLNRGIKLNTIPFHRLKDTMLWSLRNQRQALEEELAKTSKEIFKK